MIFMLKNIQEGSVFYLVNKNQFIVGRKDCDLLISDDQSISRKHAIIRIKDGKVTIEDCGSKYNTFYKNEKVQANVEIQLNVNEVIQFGVINSKYRLEQLTFVTTGTRLNGNQKTKLKNDLSVLGGQYVENWTSDCTHLTVEEITLTVKVLHALIDEKPIVKPGYWSKFAENVAKNLPPPNINKYNKPPVAEALLNKIELQNNPERKTLFKGKLFVFAKEKTKKQMEEVIRKAGGTSISWDKNPLPLSDVTNSPKEFVIIQTPDAIDDPYLNDIIKYFSKQGKRTIPLQEIAMSIVLCSCEKDCNPCFNRVEQVFPTTRPSEPTQNNALVLDTQSEFFPVREYKQEEDEVQMIIPDTFEDNVSASEFINEKSECRTNPDKENGKQILKRHNDEESKGTPSKKLKIDKENAPREQNRTSTVKEEGKAYLSKSIFPQKRNTEDDDPDKVNAGKSNVRQNPFASLNKNKKNKVEANSSSKSDNPFKSLKRPNNDVPQIKDENPFKLSFGKKKRESDDGSDLSVCKRKKNENTKDRIFSSTLINSSPDKSVNISKISKISTVDGAWFSKKSGVGSNENIENSFETEMQNFIDQFRDTVVVEVMTELPLRTNIYRDDVDGEMISKDRRNFKRFIKIRPLRPQITIIGKDNFVAQEPEECTGIADSRVEHHFSDDEAEENVRSKKKAPKKFFI